MAKSLFGVLPVDGCAGGSQSREVKSNIKTHTKPIRVPKMWLQEHTIRNTKERKENARSRYGATAPGANAKQGAAREDKLGRIGKDEVPSSNLGSSSTKSLEPQRFDGFLLFVSGGVISEFVTVLLPEQMREMQRKTEKKKE